MPKLTSAQAGQVIQKSDQTIRRHVQAGRLPAEREGMAGKIWVEVADLRHFAERYHYRFDAELAARLMQGGNHERQN